MLVLQNYRASCLIMVIAMFLEAGAKSTVIPSFAGPFIVYVDKTYACLVNGRQSRSHVALRATHFNPSRPTVRQRLSGYANMSTHVDDTWGFVADLAVRSNNQWKEHAFIFKFPSKACSTFRANVPDLFRIVFQKLGDEVLDNKKKCVVPKDNYTFENEPIDWVFPNFPIMPYGHYRLAIFVGPNGISNPTFCLHSECHIIPKPP